MQLVMVKGIDPTGVASAVDAQTYARGVGYARQRAVLHMEWMEWDGARGVMRAVVRGSGGACYETAVYFKSRGDVGLTFAFGECTCPVGIDCKHVVAVAVTAAGARSPDAPAARLRPAPSWEQSLAALLGSARPGPQDSNNALPLAIELSLSLPPAGAVASRVPGTPKLLARLVRPGRSGWVTGGLSWGRLDSPYYFGDYRAAHVRLLRELYALHRSYTGAPSYIHRAGGQVDRSGRRQRSAAVVMAG
jgi:SWIM zinc finger